MDPKIARPARRADPQAARHPAGHRPDRLGQDHHAVFGARAPERQHPQHHDGRGPDRVLHRRHRPDPGEHQGRDDLRARPARDPAPGPGRGHGRRDPRPRDRADRGAGVADRPPRALDPAHQHRRRRGHAPARHGHRAVPALLEPDRRGRAAPGAGAEPGDARAVPGRRLRAPAAEPRPERPLAGALPPGPRRGRRLPRPHRHLRAGADRRRDAHHDPRRRLGARPGAPCALDDARRSARTAAPRCCAARRPSRKCCA